MFEVLTIGFGDEVLGAATEDARARHLRYAEGVDHLHMIVWGRRHGGPVSLSPKLTVYPVGRGGRASYMGEALRVGSEIIRRHPIKVISTQDPFYTAAIGLRLRRLGPRLQIQNHSDFFDNTFWLGERPLWNTMLNAFGKWAVRRADRLRVVNTTEREKYAALGIPADRVDVLPVPVDLSSFGRPIGENRLAALRARWQIAPGAPVLFWVGRPVPFKDLGMLLRALTIIRRQWPDACTIFGGDFSGAEEWPALARELELAEAVRFVGPIPRDELADYFALCSVYLHASMYEGFGRVMVEAAAAGRPVVATDTAGAKDIVRDGETGLLCPPRDLDGFADSVLQLLSAPDRSAAMGAAARRWVKGQFDPERLTHGIIAAWRAAANPSASLRASL
jgi:glycosyltransferase involved in cell wall biosynthesis